MLQIDEEEFIQHLSGMFDPTNVGLILIALKDCERKKIPLDAVVRERIAEIMDELINGDNGYSQTQITRVSAFEEAKGKLEEGYYGS